MRSELVSMLVILAPVLTAGSVPPSIAEQPKQQAARMLDPVIESIEVVDVSTDVRSAVLTRIGVRVGDTLTADAKQKIGAEIGRVRKGMTFSYTPGVAPGTVKLRIDSSC